MSVRSDNDKVEVRRSPVDDNYYQKVAKNQMIFDEEFGLFTQPCNKNRIWHKGFSRKCSLKTALNILFGFIPILHWLPKYKIREYLLNDLIGGFTVGIMHVPQGMAYASLAGLDPINGLYTSFFPPLIYMFFGTSRHISLGVFAIVSLMVGSTNIRVTEEINQFAITQNLTTLVDGLRYGVESIEVVTALTLCVGLIQIVMGLLRLDFLTQYMSDQVIKGFTTGAAVHVFVAQLNKLIGVPLSRHSGFGKLFKVIRDLYEELSSANMVTITISTINIIVLYVCKNYLSVRLKKVSRIPVPFDLIIVIIGLIISKVLQLETSYNVQVVGNIPIGLPSPAMPKLSLFPYIWSDALAISIIVIVVGVSMGSLFAKKNNYAIDIRQEFYAMGLTECGSSLFPCWPAATALARSVIYESAGTKTQLATIFSSVLLLLVIFLVGPLMRALPVCILSSVIIVALKGMFIQFLELETLWLQSKIDFALWLVTFGATVFCEVIQGLAIGIICALVTVIYRLQRLEVTRVGRMSHSQGLVYYRPLNTYRDAHHIDGVCCVQFCGPILFFNVNNFKESLLKTLPHKFRPSADFFKKTTAISHKRTPSDATQRSKLDLIIDEQKTVVPDISKILTSEKRQDEEIKDIVVDVSGVPFIDVMGSNALLEVYQAAKKEKINLYFAGAQNNILNFIRRSDFCKSIKADDVFYPSMEDVIQALKVRK